MLRMRRKFIGITIFSIVAISLIGQSSKVKLGVGIYPNIGLDYVSARNSGETKPKLGIGTGFQLILPSKNKLNVGLEMNLLKTQALIKNYKGKTGYVSPSFTATTTDYNGSLNVNQFFIQFPIFLRYNFASKTNIFFDFGIDYKYLIKKLGKRKITVTRYFPVNKFPLIEQDRLDEPLVYDLESDDYPCYDSGIGLFISVGWTLVLAENQRFDIGVRFNNGAAFIFDKSHNPKFRNVSILIVYNLN